MNLLASLGLLLLGMVAIGWLAHQTERNPRLGRSLATILVLALLFTLIVSIIRGEFLRYGPHDTDWESLGPPGEP